MRNVTGVQACALPISVNKHTHTKHTLPVLLVFVSGLTGFAAAVLPVGGRNGVDGGALLAGRV